MRATRDIDLLCDAADLDRLKRGLDDAGLVYDHRTGDAEDPIQHVLQIHTGDGEIPYKIDIRAGIADAPSEILARSRPVDIEGLPVPVASPEDVIVLKLLAGSARDLEDALSIMRAQKHRIDHQALRQLCPDRAVPALQGLVDLLSSREP